MNKPLTAALCLLGSILQADAHQFRTSHLSVLTATRTDEPGCAMRIDIDNHPTDRHQRMQGVLGVDGIGVVATMTLNIGSGGGEIYDFEPPAGYTSRPPSIDVLDGSTAYVLICPESLYLGF